MTYYVDPSVFYWINVCNGIYSVSLVIMVLSVIAFGVVALIIYFKKDDGYEFDDIKEILKVLKITIAMAITSLLLVVFVPDKKTCIEMLIAKNVTVENVNTTIDGTKELIDYIFEKVNTK